VRIGPKCIRLILSRRQARTRPPGTQRRRFVAAALPFSMVISNLPVHHNQLIPLHLQQFELPTNFLPPSESEILTATVYRRKQGAE